MPLGQATRRLGEVARHAARLGIWAVVGSAHRLSGTHKPHNSVYVFDDSGDVVGRYDKPFRRGMPTRRRATWLITAQVTTSACGTSTGSVAGRLSATTTASLSSTASTRSSGHELVFHSFHAGNMSPQRLAEIEKRIGPELRMLNPAPSHTYPGITMPAAMTAAAASNHIWISCPNTSARKAVGPRSLSGRTG